jgi:predicted ATPase/DNA-binding SARP family transcriptional activator
MFGRPRIQFDGHAPIELVSTKAQALLIYLAITRDVCSRTMLAGLLWGDFPEELARSNLRQTLTKLRKAVGDHIAINWEQVAFNVDQPYQVDAVEFLALINETRSHRHRHPDACPACAERWRQAMGLYQQSFLRDLFIDDSPEFEHWVTSQRELLHHMALEALDHLTAFYLRHADYVQAQCYARRQLELDPTRESAYRQLMYALDQTDQRSAALAQYQRCAHLLKKEFDAEPEAATQELHAAIKRGELLTSDLPQHNLPAPVTPFIGRANTIIAIQQQLADPYCRLLTLVGPGGVGKTRLALESARGLLRMFDNGVYFIDLAPLADPQLVVGAIAQAVGVKDTGSEPLGAKLKHSLPHKDMLLILDNVEHVLDAAPFISELLAHCPRLTILAASREPLRLSGEHIYPALPLELPADNADQAALLQGEAVRLFIQRAQAVSPHFAFSPATTITVADLCRQLDGLPLAIELAAGQINRLPPAAMLAQLQSSALDLLCDGPRDLPLRQQTMRAAIAWSSDLLDATAQCLFQRLAVFAGGFTLQAVATVCLDEAINSDGHTAIDLASTLGLLADKHLIQQSRQNGAGRYTLLATIREYALEQLAVSGEAQLCRKRHAHFFLTLVEQVEPAISGPDQQQYLDQLETEHANIRAALRWAIDSAEPNVALRIAGALWRFWETRSYLGEGRRWLEEALYVTGPVAAAVRAKALNSLGMLVLHQEDYALAQTHFEASLALQQELGNLPGKANALNNLGLVAWWQGDYGAAERLYAECLVIDQASDDQMGIAYSLGNLGLVYHHQGRFEQARITLEESLGLFKALGNRRNESFSLHNLGIVAYHQHRLADARELYQVSLTIKEELGDKWGIASSLIYLAQVYCVQGELNQARELLLRSMALCRELEDKRGLVETLEGLAMCAAAQQQAEEATIMFGAAQALREQQGLICHAADQRERARHIDAARSQIGNAAFEAAWAHGQLMDLEQAVAIARNSLGAAV